MNFTAEQLDPERCAAAIETTPWALKEWTSVVHALRDGKTCVLIRKGGIHEPGFAMRATHAVLFPTGFHDGSQPIAPGDGESRHASRVTGVPVDAAVTVLGRWRIDSPEQLRAVAPLTPLTSTQLETRFALRPKHALWALLVCPFRLRSPQILPWHRSYGGCRSWVQLDKSTADITPSPFFLAAASCDAAFLAAAATTLERELGAAVAFSAPSSPAESA